MCFLKIAFSPLQATHDTFYSLPPIYCESMQCKSTHSVSSFDFYTRRNGPRRNYYVLKPNCFLNHLSKRHNNFPLSKMFIVIVFLKLCKADVGFYQIEPGFRLSISNIMLALPFFELVQYSRYLNLVLQQLTSIASHYLWTSEEPLDNVIFTYYRTPWLCAILTRLPT